MDWDFLQQIGNAWKRMGKNGAYVREISYKDQDAFIGYRSKNNGHSGRVNSDTHWHIYQNRGQPMMQLKCFGQHMPPLYFNRGSNNVQGYLNTINQGLNHCWSGGRKKSKITNKKRSQKRSQKKYNETNFQT